jgi:C4-dicarboxylate-specific signal transduction histidine kinase
VGAATFDGERDTGVAFVMDLSAQKRAEALVRDGERRNREIQFELEHANRVATMGQLSASIAHEINQPLAASLTNAQTALRWLAAAPPKLEKARQTLNRIVENNNRASEIVSGIRALIKKEPPKRELLNLNQIVADVIAIASNEARQHNIKVRIELGRDLRPSRADRVQLRQVLLNLVVNAIEAMRDGRSTLRELRVATMNAEAEGVLVVIADTGPGFGAVEPERLFDNFYTTKSSGLGMGLSICRSIVEELGGQLRARANVPQGAVFEFNIPPGDL